MTDLTLSLMYILKLCLLMYLGFVLWVFMFYICRIFNLLPFYGPSITYSQLVHKQMSVLSL